MSGGLTYAATGRSMRTAVVVALIWLAVLAAGVFLAMSSWIMAFMLAFTLPALWDLISNPPSGLALDEDRITWFSGKRHAEVALDEIELVRLDTRLDFSVKVTLILKTGAKIRIPFEATPPHVDLENALTARGITVQRHHFQLMQ